MWPLRFILVVSKRPTTGFQSWNRHYTVMQPTDKSMRALSPRMFHRTPGLIVTGFLSYLQFIIRHDNFIPKLVRMGFIDPAHVNASIPTSFDSLSREYDAYYQQLATEASRTFFRYVMKPQPWVEARVNEVLDPIRKYFLFGMHIRMGNAGGSFKDSHTFLQLNEIWRYPNAIEMVIKQRNLDIQNTRWVLCTDSDKAEEELRRRYGELIVTSQDFKRGHSKTGAKDDDGFSRAVIDMLLLSKCNFLVLTRHSTYSVIAGQLLENIDETIYMASRGY